MFWGGSLTAFFNDTKYECKPLRTSFDIFGALVPVKGGLVAPSHHVAIKENHVF